jgi:uncharacterized membrane protein YbaN (DUF454 family)
MPPRRIGGYVLALLGFTVFLSLAVGLFFFEAPVAYELKCDRSAGVCTFTEQRLGKSRVTEAKIESLGQATIQVATSGWPNPRTAVWVGSRKAGAKRFAAYWSRGEAEEAARTINSFLRDPKAGHVVLTKSVPLTYWIAGALIPVMATLFVVLVAAVLARKAKPQH